MEGQGHGRAGSGSAARFALTNNAAPAKKADLGIELTGPSTLKKGDSATFTVKVTNLGPDTAADVITTAALPSSGLTSPRCPGRSTRVGGLVVWSKVATLAKGAVADLHRDRHGDGQGHLVDRRRHRLAEDR